MKRKMLINAQRSGEIRVAIVADGALEAFQVEVAEAGLCRGNIYRAVVAKVHPALDAAFVDFGAERHAFLKADDVVAAAYHRPLEKSRHPHVDKVLERGRSIIVQVTKDASGEKGAAVTTNLSIAGRYLVLLPFENTRGVSRKVEDDVVRKELQERAGSLDVPEGFGMIIRTNALGQTKTTLNRDLTALLRLWKRIRGEAGQGKGPRLLYSDQDLVVQALRDSLDSTIEEVLVDSDEAFEKAKSYMAAFMPRTKTRLVRYRERMPLFALHQLEPQIEAIFQRTVALPSGGSIVIDSTEALTAIDVNSGRSTRGGNQEETASNTNLEAATEVARQLRLRDIGGLVVVDFIDMRSHKRQRDLERAVREAMKVDRARSYVGKVSPNGLLEINRQRLKPALQLRTHRPCPTCGGGGRIASPEQVALRWLRRVEAQAAAGDISGVKIRLHPELADSFQNHYRQELAALEREFEITIEVQAATSLHRSEEEVEWTRREASHAPAPRGEAAVSVADFMSKGGGRGERKRSEEKRPEPSGADEREGEDGVDGDEADLQEGAEQTGEKRPRRRRRGGRKRRKSGAAQEVSGEAEAAESPEVPDAAESQDDAPGEGEGEPDGESAAAEAKGEPGKAKKRRRGGKKRRKSSAARENGGEETAPEAGEPGEVSEDGDEAAPGPDGDAPESAEGAAKAKKRRRRRRRPAPAPEEPST